MINIPTSYLQIIKKYEIYTELRAGVSVEFWCIESGYRALKR